MRNIWPEAEQTWRELDFSDLVLARHCHREAGDVARDATIALINKLAEMGLDGDDTCKIILYHGIAAWQVSKNMDEVMGPEPQSE